MSDFDQESIGAQLDINTMASRASVEELKTDIDKLNAAMEFLATGFRKGSISEEQFLVSSKMVKAELVAKKEILGQVAGDQGFGGMAQGVFKAERALNAMVSGQGLARAGSMLEGVLGSIGGPAGLGYALIALELGARVLAPTLEKVFGSVTDEHIGKVHQFTMALADLVKEGEKLSGPAQSSVDKLVKKYLQEGAGMLLSETLEGAIRQQLTDAWKKQIAGVNPQLTENAQQTVRDEAAKQAAAIMGGLGHAEEGAMGRAQALIGQMATGRQQLQELQNRIAQGRLDDEAARLKENFVGPPNPNVHEMTAKAERASKKAEHDADEAQKAADRANDPSNQLRAMEEREKDALDRQVLGQWNAGGRQETPEQVAMIARNAQEARRLGASIADAVQQGYWMAVQQVQDGFFKQMNPTGHSHQIGGSPY